MINLRRYSIKSKFSVHTDYTFDTIIDYYKIKKEERYKWKKDYLRQNL